MSTMSDLEAAMKALGSAPPANSKKDEYSGPDGPDGMTVVPEDPILQTQGVPSAPPITAAQRGKLLPGTRPSLPVGSSPAPILDNLAAIPEIAPEAPGANSGALKLVFTGLSGSGKSTIAKQLGLQELQIQDDIVQLYQEFFPGTQPPSDFLNTLLIWGEGVVDAKAPVTPARLMFVSFVQGRGWTGFGQRGFWQRQLLQRVAASDGGVAVTTCTTNEMLAELKANGFAHFHIACSNQTLPTRKRRQGANDALATAFTNQLIREVSMRPAGSTLPCVWNDSVPAPSPRFLTLETLRQTLVQNSQSVVTGE